MKKLLLLLFITGFVAGCATQKKSAKTPSHTDVRATPLGDTTKRLPPQKIGSPKPYSDVITGKAITKPGLFTVHKVDEKWYFEIPDSLMNREIIAITRYSKVPGGAGLYGGELANQQTIAWEKGPNNNIFLRVITTINVADSSNQIYKAVTNSNLNPIAGVFDIKAFGKDTSSVVIDVTDFFRGDNQVVSINPFDKRAYNLSGLISDRSYIANINSYPINTEVKTVKTFNSSPSFGGFAMGAFPSANFPAASAAGAVTLEINNSFVLLPKAPMSRRMFDPRVGYFADDFTRYGDDQQKVKNEVFVVHWRLEPKEEDMDKWKQGELVEPKKPIIYYIDPATPKKWRPYLIAGINDWQKAFEKAGFKNAIIGKEWPDNDSSMSLEDARFSVVRYFASDIENAYGPNVHDPRSGEIIESHIGWYHNVMKLVHDWYMIQAAAVDPKARKMKFDDSLMGQLIRFVSSHEIGHTLGLRHNMGSSSTVPVESLRNKAWVEAHGHTPSIMDYARFNYVAQPEDSIPENGLFPHIGEYDKWAIQWGYSYTGAKNEEEDKKIVNKWIVDSLKANPRLWFGTEVNPYDPHSQTEDLGNNNMKASAYGIKNLQRILAKLPEWTREEADTYDNLEDMYTQLTVEYNRFMFHVLKNVGGIYEVPKSVEQTGDVYTPTPKATQKEAIAFLNKQLFETPAWLLNRDILNKFSNPVTAETVGNIQTNVINSLVSNSRLSRMVYSSYRFGTAETYNPDEMLADAENGIWSELATKKPIDMYRRNLQKAYAEALINLLTPSTGIITISFGPSSAIGGASKKSNDVVSIARAHLTALRSKILAAVPGTSDKLSKYHLQDVAERIKQALEPK
jgi:hypothetical protein